MASPGLVALADAVSRFVGWTYFFCWSISFYPQPILNYRRFSTIGLAIDFPTLNVLGFICYTISTTALYYSPLIRAQYAIRNPVSPTPTVRFNDLAFAVHAVILSSLVYSQFCCWGFKRERTQRISRPILGIVFGSLVGLGFIVYLVLTKGVDGGRDAETWAWIDVVYAISFVKLLVTVVKYIPQAWINYKRKSTVGWSISPILLDLAGGLLSILQLVIDSSVQADWSGLTGNPVKLGLGNVSIIFDAIFMAQHYWFYRAARLDPENDLQRPLLAPDASIGV